MNTRYQSIGFAYAEARNAALSKTLDNKRNGSFGGQVNPYVFERCRGHYLKVRPRKCFG